VCVCVCVCVQWVVVPYLFSYTYILFTHLSTHTQTYTYSHTLTHTHTGSSQDALVAPQVEILSLVHCARGAGAGANHHVLRHVVRVCVCACERESMCVRECVCE
jgi:hypothetical protein